FEVFVEKIAAFGSSYTGWCFEVKGNCGKQYSRPLKARHKAAANCCFITVLTCPRLLWSWL
ncbi:MAG: hypothetical protein AAAB23_14615, partial [Pseudomonas sp.]